MDWQSALNGAVVGGVALSALVVLLTERLNVWFKLEGEQSKWAAIGLGTVLGSAFLFVAYPIAAQPFDIAGAAARIGGAFLWSFTAPWGYELLKKASASGQRQYTEKIEAAARIGYSKDKAG